MPRAVKDTKLDSRSARAALVARAWPYWRTIDEAAHLGYRKNLDGGVWVARIWLPEAGKYRHGKIGIADDRRTADGDRVFDYYAAQERARRWFAEQAVLAPAVPTPAQRARRRYTVGDAMAEYTSWYKLHRSARGLEFTRYTQNAHIVPALGSRSVNDLTTAELRAWHEGLAMQSPRRRGVAPAAPGPVLAGDALRKRKATANRLLAVLKAALNRSYRDDRMPPGTDPDAWRRVRPFAAVDQPRIRYLGADECVRLLNACAPDFRALVRAALLTGARYGEIRAMNCGDYEPDSAGVLVREAKGGKPRHIVLSDEGVALFERLTAGRPPADPLFVTSAGSRWGRSQQRRPMLAASAAAGIEPTVNFHALRHTHAAQLAMRGVSLQVIAHQLGHADSRICERHYAHLGPSYVADVLRANILSLGADEPAKVKRLQPKHTS